MPGTLSVSYHSLETAVSLRSNNVVAGRAGVGGSLSLEGEIDGGVDDEKEEYRQQASPQGSGPENVVLYVVRLQSERGRVEEPDLPGDIDGDRHAFVVRLHLKEPGNVEAD